MSFISQNQLAREIKLLSRIDVSVDGHSAVEFDVKQFITVSILRYGLEADLLGISNITECWHRRSLLQAKAIDLLSYAQDWKTLKSAYLSVMQDPGITWHRFKRGVAGALHYKWLLRVLARLFEHAESAWQWLSFDERLLTKTPRASSQLREYIAFESELAERKYDNALLQELQRIIASWLRDFIPSTRPFHPTFGPGATAHFPRMRALEKVKASVANPRVIRSITQLLWRDRDEIYPWKMGRASRTCKLVFVPKTALKQRIISKEPAWLGWLQHAVQRELYEYVDAHPRMYTTFFNQEPSRQYALEGSRSGEYATIDFSNASDSITTHLVAKLFEGTDVKELLMLLRSNYVRLPDDAVLLLHKYAPMGSALCFPTMDIILLSVCELSVRAETGKPSSPGDYVVYGDDVVIKEGFVKSFLGYANALGMTVNEDKSYWQHTPRLYREACGGEYLDGVNITPLRYPRQQSPLLRSEAPVEFEYYSQCYAFLNECLVSRWWFPNLRSAAVQLIELTVSRGPNSPLAKTIWDCALRIDYSDYIKGYDGPLAVVVPDGTATNYRCKRGFDKYYQKSYIRVRSYQTSSFSRHYFDDRELLDLWYFKATAERPDTIRDHSLIEGLAGPMPGKWVWVRWYE